MILPCRKCIIPKKVDHNSGIIVKSHTHTHTHTLTTVLWPTMQTQPAKQSVIIE